MSDCSKGGFIPAPSDAPTPVWIDPDECVIDRDRECIRPDHPTATSDGNRADAWWRCER